MTRAEALKLRSIVEQAIISLDDKTASEAAPLFPRLKKNGLLILAGTRINWNGTIKRAAVDLWDTVENNPDNAPNFGKIFNIAMVTVSFLKSSRPVWLLHKTRQVGGEINYIVQKSLQMYIHQ